MFLRRSVWCYALGVGCFSPCEGSSCLRRRFNGDLERFRTDSNAAFTAYPWDFNQAMSTVKPQAITGVTAGSEIQIMTRYPSVASTGLGQLLGRLYESIPLIPNGIKLSHLLFVLPTAPIGLLLYAWIKVAGHRHVLTNRSLQKWTFLGDRLIAKVDLNDIVGMEVRQHPGQVFYKSADLHILNAAGDTIMRLEGIPRAEVFRQNIREARDARRQVEDSLARIQARQPA